MPPLPNGLVAKINVIGPDGALVQKRQPIPASWPIEFRRSLYEGGASCSPAQVPPDDDPVAARAASRRRAR